MNKVLTPMYLVKHHRMLIEKKLRELKFEKVQLSSRDFKFSYVHYIPHREKIDSDYIELFTFNSKRKSYSKFSDMELTFGITFNYKKIEDEKMIQLSLIKRKVEKEFYGDDLKVNKEDEAYSDMLNINQFKIATQSILRQLEEEEFTIDGFMEWFKLFVEK